ncbi:hypothetical protein [Acidicapsa acidisoli]|uniref:hypothetical protein n=1 Tax=Acidicapsa acidisoli TaxID=1615681 RepID=UPI0021DFE00C|nr:hypothetical protein [Acidicapsa acidisoli]
MTGAGWYCVEAAAGILGALDREAVLGDLAESDCGALRALWDVLGLAARRHLELWVNWRPWAASFGLALPASLFLMGCSVAASRGFDGLLDRPVTASLLGISLLRMLLLFCWGWMAGFAAGAVSRRTLWASALACAAPCLICLSEWPGNWVSGLRLLLFLAPALWGVWRGRQKQQLESGWATFLAATGMLVPLMWDKGGGLYGLGLLWPGWFLVATARRRGKPA